MLIDLGAGIFDSATVDTNILISEKAQNAHQLRAVTLSADEVENMSDYVKQNVVDIDYRLDEPWTILSAIEQSIKKKIESVGTPLKDWDIRINYGIKTGLNEAFIISKEKRDELVNADPKSDEIIRPILRGKDIGRNSYTFADLYVITAYKGISLIMKETYPAVFEHLKQFEERLRKRGQCEGTATSPGSNQHHWLELDNNVSREKLDDFSKQKILFAEMVSSPRFYLDRQNFLVNDTVTFISGENLETLTIFLNSKIIFSIFKLFYAGGGLGNSGIRMKKTFLQKLP
ncbi:hypothetical protein LLT1_14950, partial [Lactococcus cremoris subsp. cremoris TIFN1]